MMRKYWGLTIITVCIALFFVSGCAKKAAVRSEEAPPQESAATVKPAAPDKGAVSDEDSRRRAEQEKAAAKAQKEAAAREQDSRGAVSVKESYILADVYFAYDKFNLTDEARTIIKKNVDWLNKNKDAKVTVEGHCDERGTAEYNLALGERRANAAAKYMSDMGIDGKRISTISYGFERPIDPGHDEAAWTKNRRAHFSVSGGTK